MSARDPQDRPSMTPGPLPPEEAEASLEPSPAPEGSLEGVPDPEGGRRAAPVLSLEARKAQRQRDREAARAARIASFIAGEEDGPDRSSRPGAKAEARAARQEGHERRDQRTEELDEARAPSAAPAPPARGAAQAAGTTRRLRGVRPDEGLAAEGRRPWAPAGAAVGSALARGTTPGRRAPLAPPEVPPPAAEPGAGTAAARRPAVAAQPRARHWLVAASFALVVLLPTVLAAWYLWTRAAPRYASYAGFSVRTEDTDSAMGILGGMAALAGASSSSDTDILYEFIRSQEIVARVDARLDLEVLWAKGDPARDPVFTYHAPGTIEDLHLHWNRMVEVYNDGSTGLLDIEVQAFTAEDAEAIAQAIVDESSTLVNRLSDIAQEDATRYAAEELAIAEERLKEARTAMTRFRNETQIVDPATAVASQMGLLSELEGQLAQTLIDLDLLRLTAPEGDPRIAQVEARQGVIEERMAAERAKLGLGPSGLPTVPGAAGEEAFADLVGQYEGLAVDQEFASQAYAAARTAYDAAVAESRRQSRYLAAHVQPTLAQRAEYPARITLTSLTFVFALLAWMIVTLAAYALRDRR